MRLKSKIREIWSGITIEPVCLLFALSQGIYTIVSKVIYSICEEANSHDQLKMTNHALCKMTDLYLEYELHSCHWQLNLKLILNSAVDLDRSTASIELLALLTSKVLLNTTQKEISHFQVLVGHFTKHLRLIL